MDLPVPYDRSLLDAASVVQISRNVSKELGNLENFVQLHVKSNILPYMTHASTVTGVFFCGGCVILLPRVIECRRGSHEGRVITRGRLCPCHVLAGIQKVCDYQDMITRGVIPLRRTCRDRRCS